MLCTCSGERFHLDEPPQSPESLATRDFSASCLSDSRFDDDSHVDDVESTLRETISLNYEEARALLGRLEYQRGNLEAALHVFEGIDVRGLRPRMVKAIAERTRPRKTRSRGGSSAGSSMSLHSVSLLLEAILLKSKSLEGLGRAEDAAIVCMNIFDIVESAWPQGMLEGIGDECKLKEMLHKAIVLLPKLWKQAGSLNEAIAAYRRALIKPWKLDSKTLSSIQKDLAAVLLYGGVEVTLPPHMQQLWGSLAPRNNIEEAILLLTILMRKVVVMEISWDPEIIDHLTFALSLSGQFEILAGYVEQILPGIYSRVERWYLLALCYSAAGQDDVALNILRKGLGHSERKLMPPILSLLLGAKLCCRNPMHACEGTKFAMQALESPYNQQKHFLGLTNYLLGLCYGYLARSSLNDSERLRLLKESLKSLQLAAAIEKNNPEAIFSLALENALQRNLNEATKNAKKYLDMVAGSSALGWELLALVVSAEQNLTEAEAIVDLAIDETGRVDQLKFLRLKAVLQAAQDKPKQAIETYRILLALIQAERELQSRNGHVKIERHKNLEIDLWLDLAAVYQKIGSFADANTCLNRARSVGYFSPKSWHATGLLLDAQSLQKEALMAFSVSLSIDPKHVPSLVSMAAVLRKIGGKSLPLARSLLMDAIHLESTNHEAWLNLGYISKLENSLQQAADCFQAAYELKESSPVRNFL